MNTHRFRILSFSLALAALLGLSVSAMAAGPFTGGGATNLSPERQQELVTKLYEDFYKSTEGPRRELFAKSRELEARMYGPNPDEKSIQALAREISDLRAKLYSAQITLQNRMIQEGLASGYGGYGPGAGGGYGQGAGGGASCCDVPGGAGGGYGPGAGGYGPGAGRGYGPGGGYGPGMMGRGYGPRGGGGGSCCE